jgi:polar amino acid transport system substrate-binding protein
MKRTISAIALALALALVSACAHMQGSGTGATVTSPSPAIDRILEQKQLRVGTAASMPPLNMTTKEGDIIGFEMDLARYIAGGLEVDLVPVAMPFTELLPALQAGKVDMILSGMTITPSRNAKVAYVGPYFISGKSILTKKATLGSTTQASELNHPGRTLAALAGSTSQLFVEKLLPRAKLVTTKDYAEAVDLVLQDKVDAMVADYPICMVSVLRYPEHELATLTEPLTYEPLGVGLPPNDPLLVNLVQNLFFRLNGSGEMEKLKNRWFKDDFWLKKLP